MRSFKGSRALVWGVAAPRRPQKDGPHQAESTGLKTGLYNGVTTAAIRRFIFSLPGRGPFWRA